MARKKKPTSWVSKRCATVHCIHQEMLKNKPNRNPKPNCTAHLHVLFSRDLSLGRDTGLMPLHSPRDDNNSTPKHSEQLAFISVVIPHHCGER